MSRPAGRRWHSWHIHADTLEPRALGRLLTDVVGPLVDVSGSGRPWFFVRYWLHGPHLRLRVADLDDAGANDFECRLVDLVAQSVPPAPPGQRIDEETYLRAAAPIATAGELGSPVDAGSLRQAGVYRDVYQPELSRYGGVSLMPLTEMVFHASSATVLRIGQETTGSTAEGGVASLLGLEALAVTCGVLPWESFAFLGTMRDLWIKWLVRGRPDLDADTVDRAARVAAVRIVELDGVAGELDRAMRGDYADRWAGWVDAVRIATPVWRQAFATPVAGGIVGSHLHMTQNRLGVLAGGEAYLAAILLHVCTSRAERR